MKVLQILKATRSSRRSKKVPGYPKKDNSGSYSLVLFLNLPIGTLASRISSRIGLSRFQEELSKETVVTTV